MYIKQITIEGFKSYGRKVEVGLFDKQFNAITGLNGTGKSNILDSICFVLGSNNMSLARVSNLRELIFKSGQTGVHKATVSVVFDNSDPDTCPPTYESYPTITVTREVNLQSRSKYYINGFVAQGQQVADLFHSVQLNINNPHFLIMQGRITKVLNMKPHEILSMVEEATGASRFELKKKASYDKIAKKQKELNEVDHLLNEEILPKLEKLKKEQSGLQEYNRLKQQTEHLSRVYTAFQYVKCQEMCDESGSKISAKKESISGAKNTISELETKVSDMEDEIKRLEEEKDKEFGGALGRLDEELKQVQMTEAKTSTVLKHKKDLLAEEKKKKTSVEKLVQKDSKLVKQKEVEYSNIKDNYEELEAAAKSDEQKLEQAQKDFEAISAGASRAADGEAAGTLADQLIQAKNEVATTATEITKANMKLKHCKDELCRKQAEARKTSGNYEEAAQKVGHVRAERDKLKAKLDKINFDEDSYAHLLDERRNISRECNQLNNEIANEESRNYNTKFEHGARVDNRKVLGVVCNLFTVKDPSTALAIQECVGGRLYNVVVEDVQTAKCILDSGTLKRQTTLLPLDKIQGRKLDRRVLQNAENLVGATNVKSAISLVDFEPHLEPVMEYLFGDNLVCTDMNIGKKVAYAHNVKKRTITLDGEVFDPSGTLSGGSRRRGPGLLEQLAELKMKKDELQSKRNHLEKVEQNIRRLEEMSRSFKETKNAFENKEHELRLIEKNLENTNQYQLQQEVERMTTEVGELDQALKDLPVRKKNAEKKAKDLEMKMKDSKSIRERELKEAQQFLKQAQADYDKSRRTVSEKTQLVESLKFEIEELNKTIASYLEQISGIDLEIEKLEAEVQEVAEAVEEALSATRAKVEEVEKQKQLLNAKSDDIRKLSRKKDSHLKTIENLKLEIKKLVHEIETFEKESTDAAHKVKHLLKKNAWINDEKHLFGNENAGYPFKRTDFDPREVKENIEANQDRLTKLSKTVNMRATALMTDRESDASDLTEKRARVEKDKKILLEYIKEVDEKKREELEKAYVIINKHFGSIFSSILPGTSAKLTPSAGKTVHEGLEVKIAFGGVWKETLTELSGGQRSLVALSLILALLRYNPAPIYILDEVDAALDQSHTTNIGRMIKDNFPNSQFLIVSLKDDMFNNANVLFKTRFVDGASSVSRHTKNNR
ncbi:Structural maintenance of chromosomes protein 2 [Halotydeus destructor]|nr:Structural maintenance of chromosomes protein 2 [Halotydeus destructor]